MKDSTTQNAEPVDSVTTSNKKMAGSTEKIKAILLEVGLLDSFINTLLTSLSNSFEPERAFTNLERFLETNKNLKNNLFLKNLTSDGVDALVPTLSGSQYLSDILIRNPDFAPWLLHRDQLNKPRFKDVMEDELTESVSESNSHTGKITLLKRFKNREYVRLGMRDLIKKADTVETLEDISNIADVTCHKAYEIALEQLVQKYGVPYYENDGGESLPCEFTIIGMGKLGGRELNFSSDIDLIYIYTSDNGKTTGRRKEGGAGPVSNHEFFSFLSREITKILSELTEQGSMYRVDLDLRPEGTSGNIVNSLRSMEIYYESWGETWERQAMIKARQVGGSFDLGNQFRKMITPFVYRKYLDFPALKEIREMKEKVNKNISKKRENFENDIKLGHGGIREAEFILQSFQLIYGGKDTWLREKNSMRLLHRLSEKGLLSYGEYADISKAYFFLRDLENRVQMKEGRQVHHIPSLLPERALLAKKMGFAGDSESQLDEKLMAEYRKYTAKIHGIYGSLLSANMSGTEEPSFDESERIYVDNIDDTKDLLKSCEFQDIESSYNNLLILRDGTIFSHPTRRSKIHFEAIISNMLKNMSQLPEPDLALKNFLEFVESGRSREMIFTLLSANRPLLETLSRVFGYSNFLSNILIQKPELFDYLINSRVTAERFAADILQKEASDLMAGKLDYEEGLDALRRFKRGVELTIGVTNLSGEFDLEETFHNISTLADVYISESLSLVRMLLRKKYGKPGKIEADGNTPGMAVIGLGKLGGNELNYASDLDVIFVYSGDGESEGGSDGTLDNKMYYTKLCEKLIHSIVSATRYGFGYKVDTRLRPEGDKGELIMSLESYKKYYESRGSIWEKQALLKSRFIAGDKNIGKKFLELAENIIYKDTPETSLGTTIYTMRTQLETDNHSKNDFKIGRGGVVDIEFATQYLQMQWGNKYPELRKQSTLNTLRSMKTTDILDTKDIDSFITGYLFLRGIESKIRMNHDRPVNRLPSNTKELEGLVKRLGYRGQKTVQPFLEDFQAVTDNIRAAYERVFKRV